MSATLTPAQHAAALMKEADTTKERLSAACFMAALQGITVVRSKARSKGVFDTGSYVQSWKAEKLPDGASLYNSSAHAPIVEMGRGAGSWPPLDPIALWVSRKLSVESTPGETNAQANRRVAFLVARKIKTKGIKAKSVLGESLEKLGQILEKELAKVPGKGK